MPSAQLCALCHKRKAKRYCPGIRAEICAICCGTEREVTVDCPLECPYLRESRKHAAHRPAEPAETPFPEVEISEAFLYEHEQLIGQIGYRLLRYSLENSRVYDRDVIDALDKLARTYQTQASGIYYESVPENTIAAGLFRDLRKFLEELQQRERERGSIVPLKESDLIRTLVFLTRLATIHSNQRPRGRAFIDFLRATYPEAAPPKDEPRLIVPG